MRMGEDNRLSPGMWLWTASTRAASPGCKHLQRRCSLHGAAPSSPVLMPRRDKAGDEALPSTTTIHSGPGCRDRATDPGLSAQYRACTERTKEKKTRNSLGCGGPGMLETWKTQAQHCVCRIHVDKNNQRREGLSSQMAPQDTWWG